MKRITIVVVAMGLLLWGCDKLFEDMQSVADGYQSRYDYKGELERKYAANGAYAVDTLTVPSNKERIKLYQFYFPTELKSTQKQWPVVIMANGTGTRASKYRAVFRHLASWGFIVAGNEDEWTWDGKSVDMTLDYVLRANENPQSPLYQRVDTAHVGLTGHSQGGMAVYTAAALFDNSHCYKALCTQSGTAVMLADSLGWDFLKDVKAPMLMMGGCGVVDANVLCKLDDMKKSYDAIGSEQKVLGRIKNTDHSDVLPRGDAYMTAWMRFWLCGDEEARKCFFGDHAEILGNEAWQDVKRENI